MKVRNQNTNTLMFSISLLEMNGVENWPNRSKFCLIEDQKPPGANRWRIWLFAFCFICKISEDARVDPQPILRRKMKCRRANCFVIWRHQASAVHRPAVVVQLIACNNRT